MRAILAGRGVLPGLLLASGDAVLVQFDGVPVDVQSEKLIARFERLGDLFANLRSRGVTEICLAGSMTRPALDPAALDPFTAAHMPILVDAMAKGDDGLLRAVIALIESEGFHIVAASDLRPDLMAPADMVLGEKSGTQDAARGRDILAALGPLDIGQGAVVANGAVLGIETVQGTDALLQFVEQTVPRSGGVFVKRPKPGQDLRVDMPAIGPETIRNATNAGLSGIEIAAQSVLLLDRPAVEAACAETGLNLWTGP